jgi:hypothetical protein
MPVKSLHYTTPDGKDFEIPLHVEQSRVRDWLKDEGYSEDDINTTLSKPRSHTILDEPFVQAIKNKGAAAVTGLGKGVVDLIASAPMSEPSMTGARPEEGLPTPEEANKAVGRRIGGWHEPTDFTERLIEGGSRALPAAVVAPSAPTASVVGTLPRAASYLAKLFAYGFGPGAASEAAGEGVQSIAENVPEGMKGTVAKAENPVRMLTSMFSPMAFRKAITPKSLTDPERLRANRVVARDLGGNTAGQFHNDPKMMARESNANPNINNEQAERVNRFLTRRAGEESPSVSAGYPGSWVDRNLRRTGQNIENIANASHINPRAMGTGTNNPQIYNDLVNTAMRRPQDVPQILQIMQGINHRFVPQANLQFPEEALHNALFRGGRRVSGQDYNRLRGALHEAADKADPSTAFTLRSTANALDEGMRATNPAHYNAWNEARRQAANTYAITTARGKAGSTDQLTPAQMISALNKERGVRANLRGQPELSEAVFAADSAMPKMPPPATSTPNQALPHWLGALGFGAGAFGPRLAGFDTPIHDAALYALAGAHAGETGGNIITTGSALPVMNPVVQAWKKNQLLPKWPDQQSQRAAAMAARALIEGQRQNETQ